MLLRLCLVFVVTFAAAPVVAETASKREVTIEHPAFRSLRSVQAYNCAKATCKQIRSCKEACYKFKVCGHSRRDGDGDGIPCENLCSSRCR